MKNFKDYISINEWKFNSDSNVEKLVVFRHHPSHRAALSDLIAKRIKENNEKPYLLDIDVSDVIDIGHLFNTFEFRGVNFRAIKELDLSTWNTEKALDCQNIFSYLESLEKITFSPRFNLSNCEDTRSLFLDCKSLEYLDVSSFKIKESQYILASFKNCTKLKEIKGLETWDVSNVKSSTGLFNNCVNLRKINIKNWEFSFTKNFSMSKMFYNCDESIIPSWYDKEKWDT